MQILYNTRTLISLVRWCILIGCRLPGSGLGNQAHRDARLRPPAPPSLVRDSAPHVRGKDRIMTTKNLNPQTLNYS